MANSLVRYDNNEGTQTQADAFTFKAVVDGLTESEVERLHISIYPEAYWSPLNVSCSVFLSEFSCGIGMK